MYQDTVTLFNRKRSIGVAADTWYPTVLVGVDLNTSRAAIVSRYGAESDDKAILHVQCTADGTVAGKQYLPPKAWQQAEEPAATITFNAGERFDFFAEGTCPEAAGGPVQDDAWPEGLYEHLRRTMDGVYAVSSAARFSVIPHFEITGR